MNPETVRNRPIENTEQEAKNREIMAQKFSRFLQVATDIEPFHGRKTEAVFNGDENKREFIKEIKFSEFLTLVNGINGLLRNKPKEEWKIDGRHVYLEGIIGKEVPPPFEQKEPLLKKAFEAAKRMEQDGRGLEDIAILISAGVNAIHPYNDGNGRTSRVIYTILTENFDPKNSDDLEKVLGRYGRMEVDVNPGILLAGGHIHKLIDQEIGVPEECRQKGIVINRGLDRGFDYPNGINFNHEVDPEDEKKFKYLVNHDSEFMFFAVYKYLKDRPERDKYFVWYGNRARTNIELLANDLDADGLKKILDNYNGLKQQRVEILIDSIENPDKDEYQVTDRDKTVSIFESFKKKIHDQMEK